MAIGRQDVLEAEVAEVPILASDGYSVYLANVSVISTTSGTNSVLITLPDQQDLTWLSGDHPVESGDHVYFRGTVGSPNADGYYYIDKITSQTTFTTIEPIPTSLGGFVTFMWPAGATTIGFDPTVTLNLTATTVQGAIVQLDKAIVQSNYITKQVEVNFGTVPTNYKTFTVYDSDVFPSSLLFPTQAGNAPTGKSADENEMDPIIFSATPYAGYFTLIASSKDGPVVGNFKINYGIGN